jgi:hypothetical protein
MLLYKRGGKRLVREGRWILGALAASGLATAGVASAEDALYRWETADGTVSFTDDAKRIPEKYRDGAETIDRSVITGYGRYTPTDAAAHEESARRLEERLEKLRAANAAEAKASETDESLAPASLASSAPVRRDIHRRRKFRDAQGNTYYRYYRDQTTIENGGSLPVDPNDPNPVVTEKRRVRVPGQPITQSVTVVRQGDRVLSVQKPRSHYHDLDFDDLTDLETESFEE